MTATIERATESMVSPAPRAEWLQVAAADPDAMPTQFPAWTDAACSAGRWCDASRLYTRRDGRRLVLPMVRARVPAGIGFELSMPAHWGFGGLLAEGGVTAEDVDLVMTDLASNGPVSRRIRPNPLHGDLWRGAAAGAEIVPRRAHVVDLEGGPDAVWKRFHTNARRGVRISERSALEVEQDDTGRLLPEFFHLLELSRARWAAEANEPLWLARQRYRRYDTLEKWQRIATYLGRDCTVWIARSGGRAAAGIVVLFGGNAHMTRSAMDKPLAAKTHAMAALEWYAMREACERGARAFHLGESGSSSSLSRAKEERGGRPFDYPEVRLERLPVTALDRALRTGVKRAIGFREAT